MMKIINKIGFLFIIIWLHGCVHNEKIMKNNILNNIYQCDSINVPTLTFIPQDDGSLFSPMEKKSFDFQVRVVDDCVKINGKRYYYMLVGLHPDTIGLVNINNKSYLYKKNRDTKGTALLFDFNKKVNDSWLIKEEGYFEDYQVYLEKISCDETLADTVYSFKYNFVGHKFPFGYYLEKFDVSKKYGIVSYKLTNGVECNCIIE